MSRDKFNIQRVSVFTNNVQVNLNVIQKHHSTTDARTLFFWIFFDYLPIEYSFHHMFAFESFL